MSEKKKIKKSSKKSRTVVSKDKEIKKSNKELKKDMKKMDKNPKKKKKKIGKIILIIFLVLVLLGIIAVGAVAGMIVSTFGDDWKMNKSDLVMGDSNSKIVDSEGNLLAILNGDETRQPITLDEMPAYLPKAYVSIEDERFYEHSGIDIQRTLGAIFHYLTGDSSYGGSSITQQVVKNLTKDDERAIERKIKEWGRAYNVEQILSKQQILQLYLNLIYVGGPDGQGLHGVEMGSIYYFNKSAKDLSLAECAYLAGINSSPNAYKPFTDLDENGKMPEKMQEKINKKVKIVLNKMKETGAIVNEEDYNNAIAEVDAGLKFERGQTRTDIYSYNTESAINEVIEDYMEKKECTREFAKNYIFSSGLTIHTTQVTSIQERIEEEYEKDSLVLTSKENKDDEGNFVKSQSAMVIIDHHTGYVVGSVGQLGKKTTNFSLNRAVNSKRQTGSSMKPLAVIVPGIEEGIITAGSVYDDVPTPFGNEFVKNYYGGYKGLSTIRHVIEISQNIIPSKLLLNIGTDTSIDYLEKMGITSMDRKNDASYSMALGGLTNGVSPLQMAGAYATIANSGVYIEPTFYTKVEDDKGNVVLETQQESHRVLSEANAYVVQSILTEPVLGKDPLATARNCKIPGIETCAKTGTTDESKDRWLCGFTPYYTAATWYGFNLPEYIAFSSNPCSKIFANIMKDIHTDLPNKKFDVPDNIVRVAICKDSGLLPGEHCNNTVEGDRVYTEVFVKGTVPSKICDVHVTAKVCAVEGQEGVYELANDNCPDAKDLTFITRPNSDTNTSWQKAEDAKFMLPTKVCDRHKEIPDTLAPTLTLNGDAPMKIKVGDKFKDPGASAIDEKDGDLTSKITVTGKVDPTKKGTYTLTYAVEDAAKNKTTKTRTVIVEENEVDDENTNSTNTVDTSTNTIKPIENTITNTNEIVTNKVKP